MRSNNLLCVVFSLLFVCAPSYAVNTDKERLYFGSIKEGGTAGLTFMINNSSLKTLKVGIRPSCECISVDPATADIAPGASRQIKVSVDTKGYSGQFDKEIFIQTNDNKRPYFSVKISGNVTRNAALPEVRSREIEIGGASGQKAVKIIIFGSSGCGICKRIEFEIIPGYEKKLGIKADVEQLQLDNPVNYEKLMGIEKRLNKPLTRIPAMYAGGNIYGGKDEILSNIERVLKECGNEQGERPDTGSTVSSSPATAVSVAQKLKVIPIILAGLVDSINPCAFATIVFFLSYMSLVLKKTRSEVFFAGLIFIIGVFVTYFLIGVGIFKAVLGITSILKYSKILYLVIGIFLILLAARHFYESAVLKRTGSMDDDEVRLKLPDWIRKSIEKLITEFTGLRFILPFVFLLAVIITLLELVCTGQVYLPAIIYLTSLAKYRLQAYLYLVLYCFLFVVPLIVIFAMYYFGLTTLTLKRFFKDNIVGMKITMAVFFLTMAVFMIIEGLK